MVLLAHVQVGDPHLVPPLPVALVAQHSLLYCSTKGFLAGRERMTFGGGLGVDQLVVHNTMPSSRLVKNTRL